MNFEEVLKCTTDMARGYSVIIHKNLEQWLRLRDMSEHPALRKFFDAINDHANNDDLTVIAQRVREAINITITHYDDINNGMARNVMPSETLRRKGGEYKGSAQGTLLLETLLSDEINFRHTNIQTGNADFKNIYGGLFHSGVGAVIVQSDKDTRTFEKFLKTRLDNALISNKARFPILLLTRDLSEYGVIIFE